jgi:predicted nucleic acid-binding protein
MSIIDTGAFTKVLSSTQKRDMAVNRIKDIAEELCDHEHASTVTDNLLNNIKGYLEMAIEARAEEEAGYDKIVEEMGI